MKDLLLTSIVTVLAPSVLSGESARPQPTLSPDFSAIQREASTLVEERWTQWSTKNGRYESKPLPEIEIRMIRREDNLLTNADVRMKRVHPLTDEPVYLVNAMAWADWWKGDTEHVLVLRRTPKGYECLFHYDGGWNGSGIGFKVINAGRSSRQDVLEVEDYASSNGMSQTFTHIFRYDEKADQFVEIFDELTSWGPPPVVPMGYRGMLMFEESDATLKDIVVSTQLMDNYHGVGKTSCEARFTWDGKKYQGKMNLPAALQQDVDEYLEHLRR